MKKAELDRIEQSPMRGRVVVALRRAILNGSFEPGDRLVETELAEMLGTSRGPVRDALQQLDQEGLVVIQPYRGAFVASLSVEDVLEILDLRVLLEGYAARKTAEKATCEDIEGLRTILEDMKRIAKEGYSPELVDKDMEFHLQICRLSGNKKILTLMSLLANQIRRFLNLSDRGCFEPEVVAAMHVPIFNALEQRDAQKAEESCVEALRRTAQKIVEKLTTNRDS